MSESQTFVKRPITAAVQAAIYSMVLATSVQAGPTGGQVVGGSGAISQSGLNTTINQASQNMAIDWQSYNVNSNERVQYIQPNSSSISLNRILSNNGSTIAGRIDANGQVILVNPNGIFFTPTSVINVGGIIASGLDIKPDDFMNGNYIFNDVLGKDGTVINTGTINASLGGNVALIGRQVRNDGLITANLGSVSLAAGKQAVLTFDNGGLLGVRVSKEILQDEIGVDPAVVNNGTIQSSGGRVLLTASTSQDVFSQAVNTNGIQQATSVVVNADGTFTLGAGADVVNTGIIDTSTKEADQNVGRIAMLGNNVTSSGTLKADAADGNGGEIELLSTDTTLLTGNSVTSARSDAGGTGGIVKVLGGKVGLFDQSTVDVSGDTGGGQVLIGGDQHGGNSTIQNASYTFVNQGTNIYADAVNKGDGGKVIVWSEDGTQYLGNIYVRGGEQSGNGGFVETSGKNYLLFDGAVDRLATNGENGTLLLDPYNIYIHGCGGNCDSGGIDTTTIPGTSILPFSANPDNGTYDMRESTLVGLLGDGNVILQATHNITIGSSNNPSTVDTSGLVSSSLTLEAGNDITINDTINLGGGVTRGGTPVALGALYMTSGVKSCGTVNCAFSTGDVSIAGSITAGTVELNSANNVSIDAALNATSLTVRAGNDITSSSSVTTSKNGFVSLTSADQSLQNDGITVGPSASPVTGAIDLSGNVITNGGKFTAIAGNAADGIGYFTNNYNGQNISAGTGAVEITTYGVSGGNGAVLGSISAGSLSVTTLGGNINQSPSSARYLNIAGLSVFDAGANAITLTNASNLLSGTISLNTTGNNDASLYNTASNTLLSDSTNSIYTNVGGKLTVTAENGISVLGDVKAGSDITFKFDTTDQNTNFNLSSSAQVGSITSTGGNVGIQAGSIGGNASHDFNIAGSISTAPGTGTITLTGDNGNDNFNISTLFTGNVNGNGGSDTLTGPDAAQNNQNDWLLESAGGGTLSQSGASPDINKVTFAGIENLTGGAGADAFVRTTATGTTGALTGLISGGGGSDSLTIDSSVTSPTDVKLANTNSTVDNSATPNQLTVFNVGTVTNNSGQTTTLIAPDVVNATADTVWEINDNSTTASTVTWPADGSPGTGAAGQVSFYNFNVLDAGTGGNTFNINANYTGTINGSNSTTNADTFNITAAGVQVSLINGNGGSSDSLVMQAGGDTNYWNIDSMNSGGIYNDAAFTAPARVSFNNIPILSGELSGNDSFTVASTGSIDTINGVGGNNTYKINGVVNNGITGGAGQDDITLTGTVKGLIDGGAGSSDTLAINVDNQTVQLGTTVNGNINVTGVETITALAGGTSESIIGNSVENTWTINDPVTNLVAPTNGATAENTVSFVNFTSITGGGNTDHFNFGTNLSNTTFGVSVNGGAGDDFFNIQGAGITFSNALIGGGGNDTISTNFATNTDSNYWSLNTADTGAIYADSVSRQSATGQRLSFSGIQHLIGGYQVDDFLIADPVNTFSGTIDGGAGSDVLTAAAVTGGNYWLVNATNGGAIYGTASDRSGTTNALVSFSNIETLNGNTTNDDFLIGAIGSITGSISGGAGGANSLTARNGANEWDVTGINSGALYIDNNTTGFGTAYVQNFSNIQSLIGGTSTDRFVMELAGTIAAIDGGDPTAKSNTLVARSGVDNAWHFTTTSSGSLEQTSGTAPAKGTYVSAFSNIQNFEGGGGNEWADFSSDAAATININIDSYIGFTGVIGNGANSTLTGGNQPNTWDITDISTTVSAPAGIVDGTNDGVVNPGTANQLYFVDFANIKGGNQTDNFTIESNGNVTGQLSGGAGSDTLNILNTTIKNIEIGTSGTASNLNVDGFVDIKVDPAANAVLIGDNTRATNNWLVSGTTSGTLNGMTFENFAKLQGAINSQDIFTLNDLADFTGNIDGGVNANVQDELIGGNRQNTWQITNSNNTGTVTGLATGYTFSNIDQITGNAQKDLFILSATATFAGSINGGTGNLNEVQGGNQINDWQITGANSGNVTGLSNGFSNIQMLTGGSLQDRFTLSSSANFNGTINGGNGTNDGGDELIASVRATPNAWTITGATTGDVSGLINGFSNIEKLTGATGTKDTYNLLENVVFNGSIQGNAGDADEIVGGNQVNNWTITGVNTGQVTGLSGSFTDISQLTGNSGQDNFFLKADIAFAGDINGGGGTTNTLTGANNTTIGNDWTIDAQNGGTTSGLAANHTFSNIQNLTGNVGDDKFTLSGAGVINGLIDGAGGSDTADYSALTHNISIHIGTDIANVETVVGNNGGSGASTYTSELIGDNAVNNWAIKGVNLGAVGSVNFSGFNNLTGNIQQDIFTFTSAGKVTGIIDGGDPNNAAWTPGTASADWLASATTTPDTVNMSALQTVNVTLGQDIKNIELVIGNAATGASPLSVLNAGTASSNWDVTGVNSGIVNGTQFQGFNEIHGSGQADTFLVESGGNIFNIYGGAGNDLFTVNTGGVVQNIYGEAGDDLFDIQGTVVNASGGAGIDSIVLYGANVDVTVGDSVSGFEGITAANGGIIRARDGTTTTWEIGQNGRNYVSDNGLQIGSSTNRTPAESLFFDGFTTIEGGNGTDIFNVSENGSISGQINGNAGADQLNINLAMRTQFGGQINYDGGSDAGDTITITGPANVYSEAYVSNQTIGSLSGNYDHLSYTSTANGSLALGYRNVDQTIGSVADNIVVDTLTLNSTDATNTLQLGADTFGASNTSNTNVSYAANSKNNITVLASNGSDVSIAGNVNIPGTLAMTADNVSNVPGAVITANALSLQSTTTVGAQGNALLTNINQLDVQNNAGPVYIDQQGTQSLDLAGLNTTNLLSLTASGSVTSAAALISSGELAITTSGNISLTGNNQLSGALVLSEGNSNPALNNNTFTVSNGVDTLLGDVSVMDLNLSSGGNITNSGASAVISTGRATLAATGDINLNSQNNDFREIAVSNATNVTVTDMNDIGLVTLANAATSPNIASVSITSGGKIYDAININNNTQWNIVADSVTLRAVNGIGDGSVDYDSATHTIPFTDAGAIHTQTGLLSAININPAANVGVGTININNSAQVTIKDLRNNGDIILNNNSFNILLDGNTSTDQNGVTMQLGAIDANYQGNISDPVYAGSVALLGDGNESVYTLGRVGVADITAEDLLVYTANEFGDRNIPQPIRLRINRQFSLYSSIGAVTYPNGMPTNPVSTTADLVTIEGVTGLSGQQLIDIESLGDVDPAIFTEVRNYNHEDVAILLPPDQRLSDDDEECDTNKKCKKKHAVN